MTAREHNRLLAKGRKRAARLEPELAKVLRGVFDEVADEAVRNFERAAAHPAVTAAAPTALSAMVACYPLPDEQAALAQPDGEPAPILHVTLAFLGEIDDPTLERVIAAMRQVALEHVPREGRIGGVGYFGPQEPGGPCPVFALPDVPGLPELCHAVTRALEDAGVDFSRAHGWLPHLTLAYAETETEALETLPSAVIGQTVTFRFLTVTRGDVPIHIGLTGLAPVVAGAACCPHGDPTCPCPDGLLCHYEGEGAWPSPLLSAAPPPDWRPPRPGELVDVDSLAKALRARTAPTRAAVVETLMRPGLEGVGVQWDTKNPLIAKALGSSGRHIVGVANETRAHVARAVSAAYEEGLSIPNTSKVIRSVMAEAGDRRATAIARTEMTTATSSASLSLTGIVAEETGVVFQKVWLTAPGAEYPRHEEYDDLDGQTVGLDEMFNVGGYDLEYPGDQSGPPEEVVNCRCTMEYTEVEPVVNEGEAAAEALLPGESPGVGFADLDLPDLPAGLLAEGLLTEGQVTALSGRVYAIDEGTATVAAHYDDLALIPERALRETTEEGVTFYVGDRPITELDEMGHLKGVQPRGWDPGDTWDMVRGAYSPDKAAVIAGGGDALGSSASAVLHEWGHSFGHMTGANYSPKLLEHHRRLHRNGKLDPYLSQGGAGGMAGRQELLAESTAVRLKGGRQHAVDYWDEEYVAWLDEILGIEP